MSEDEDGPEPLPPEPPIFMDGGLREAFSDDPPDHSVLDRIERMAGRKARVLLHDLPDDHSPVLRPHSHAPDRDRPSDDTRYRIVGEIARGGIGVIHKARDLDLGRDVALKVLREDRANDKEVFARFIEEAQIGAQLQHPGIVPVYGLGLQPDGRPYFAMKLIKGRTLAALLKERRNAAEGRRTFLEIFELICQTMGYAHSRGVIHRDLKPTNVMVGGFGEVQVVDWGFGKVLGREDHAAERLIERTVIVTVRSEQGAESVAGSVMGTPTYMPPEQALGHVEELDAQSDVFSLGGILCEVLTGEPPYTGSPKDRMIKAVQGRIEEAHRRLEGCGADPALVDLAKRCLTPMHSERPANAGEVARAIADHLASVERRARQAEVDAVEQDGRLQLERRRADWERRAKWRVRFAAAVLLVGIATAVGVYLRSDAARAKRAAEARIAVEDAIQDAVHLASGKQWTEARAAARRARDLAETGGVDADLHTRAVGTADRIEEDWTRADVVRRQREREAELVAKLEQVRLARSVEYDSRATDRRYAEILGDRDPEQLSATYPGALEEIATALDEWASLRLFRSELAGTDAQAPLSVARAIDPDSWRNRLRDAMESRDVDALRTLAIEAKGQDLSVRTLNTLGMALGYAGDLDAANHFYADLQPRCPDDFLVNYSAGTWLLDSDPSNAEEAARYLMAAVALRPHSAFALNNLGVAYDKMNPRRSEEAVRLWELAIAADETLAAPHHCLGGVLRERGDRAGAVAHLRESVRLDPADAAGHRSLAVALLGDGDVDGAVEQFREALRLDPDSARCHQDLGSVLCNSGQCEEAAKHFREAVRLEPDSAMARYCLGNALAGIGDVDGAIGAFRESIALKPDLAEAHCNLGSMLCDCLGQRAEAVEEFRKAIQLKPRLVNAHFNLGFALDSLEELDAARDAYREAIRLSPDYAEAYYYLGSVLLRLGRFRDALESFRRLDELDEGPTTWSSRKMVEWAEEMVALDDRLPDILAGRSEPSSATECLGFASVCRYRAKYAEAAGFYADTFALDPSLAVPQDRYFAACSAILAGTPEWRGRALDWLRANLRSLAQRAAGDALPGAIPAADALQGWLQDPKLAGVRDDAALAKLPDVEREQWRSFWKDVAATLREASK